MSLSLNGAFWPTILPMFHGSRWIALATDPMMVSHPVERQTRCTNASPAPLLCVNPDFVVDEPLNVSAGYVSFRPVAIDQERLL